MQRVKVFLSPDSGKNALTVLMFAAMIVPLCLPLYGTVESAQGGTRVEFNSAFSYDVTHYPMRAILSVVEIALLSYFSSCVVVGTKRRKRMAVWAKVAVLLPIIIWFAYFYSSVLTSVYFLL